QEGHRLAHTRAAAALGAGLTDLAILTCNLDNAPALADVVANRLLDVHILAILHRPDGRQCMPVIRRGDGHDIDVLILDDAANILLEVGSVALRPLNSFHGRIDHTRIGIANRRDDAIVAVGEAADMAHAAPAHADNGDPKLVVGASPDAGALSGRC